ncbi:MAG: haloacid dehalogenase-like hydrolase [Oscillospiraceae bacterium]|jgi:phosphoserine phosphatase|nr:haloacid dehalogenase-like hydrolase [Oscillospiraceae bacterium]MCI9391287.1 haloacid dehalogenase-like hydrolase [Oscillospiraceae bacterium]
MNVYDFDETIFTGDSEDYFFAYLFKKPGFFWDQVRYRWYELLFKCKLVSKTKAREAEYSLLRKIDDLDGLLADYWDQHERHMKSWYAAVKRPDDVIASATPRFLMEPIVARLGLTGLVATEMDPRTGKIHGEFAAGPYKVDQFRKQFSLDEIDEFYSDAYSDHFLAEYAKRAYVVHGDGERTEWNAYFATHKKK